MVEPAEAEAPHTDSLPADLDMTGFVGPVVFPDNARRRLSAAIYGVAAGGTLLLLAVNRGGGVLPDNGLIFAAVLLGVIGLYHALASAPLRVKETDALGRAARAVGFPVGHASAQLAWRGLRSRPTWRILLYSADEPPTKRGFVLVDGVDGAVVDQLTEDNPETWT